MVNLLSWECHESLNNTTFVCDDPQIHVAIINTVSRRKFWFVVWRGLSFDYATNNQYDSFEEAVEAAERYLDGYVWDDNDGSWYLPEKIQIGSEE